jgi:hypothetical protein
LIVITPASFTDVTDRNKAVIFDILTIGHHVSISAHLLVAGESVFHILGPDSVAPASLTKVATPRPDGTLTYPACRRHQSECRS